MLRGNNLQKGDLVARLLGFEHRYGGNLIVAKQSIDLTESVQTYFNDVRTQSVSQLFANEYNKYNQPKKVAFIKVKFAKYFEGKIWIKMYNFFFFLSIHQNHNHNSDFSMTTDWNNC